MPDPDPVLDVQDIIDALPMPIDPGWDELTTAQQQLTCMFTIEGQVFNGGFHQVYYNNCHPYLPMALDGFRAIGATDYAEIVEQVMAMVAEDPRTGPPEIWPDPNAPDLPEGSKDIGDFDRLWYALDWHQMMRKIHAYIVSHPDEFPRPRS